MRHPSMLAAAVVLVAVATLGLTACGSSGGGKSATPAAPVDLRGQSKVEIEATGNRFVPADVVVDEGTTVTWVNKDSHAHDVKKSADALDFGAPFGVSTDKFGPNETYSFTFEKLGTFPYTCTIHALMNGKVTVVAKATGAPTSTSLPAPSTTG
jgi:plastocyanin